MENKDEKELYSSPSMITDKYRVWKDKQKPQIFNRLYISG